MSPCSLPTDFGRRPRRSVARYHGGADRRRRARSLRNLVAALLLSGGAAAAADRPAAVPPPWEVWRDLAALAVIPTGDRVVMRSSHCPDGCALDRHSADDSRFLRSDGQEGVLFEAEGPGVITRIWMTQGDDGVSGPLDPEVWIRIVVDGEVAVQLPLPDFFGGEVPPFAPPLVEHRLMSSGGNISLVPIAYRESCVVSLLGAEEAKLWFQITAHELATGEGVAPFTGEEDLEGWQALLGGEPAADPWAGGPFPTSAGSIELGRGTRAVVAAFSRADVINGLLLRLPRDRWDGVELRLLFDGAVRVSMPVADFFGVGGGDSEPVRSLLFGATDDDDLYAYFPMPFFESAVVELARGRTGARGKVPVEFAVRRVGRAPHPDSGLFGAASSAAESTTPGRPHRVLAASGRGKWVGLFAELGSRSGGSRDYLEGDEQVLVDGGPEPLLRGTGVEDFFGGGFYFQIDRPGPVPFRHPLHGMTEDRVEAGGTATTAMYRLMLGDAPIWSTAVEIDLECGPVNQTPIRARTVAYYYSAASAPEPTRDTTAPREP
ncbi:MAG TPA: DUF2961 domain-containing protein [Thermoanaerobaculales bacterium]|nr:DUF2961 domain-containing protein [Thermoanaerobaculales bacterium]HPA79170.1 DUF2961 domain-containing protein [Thermoanaerobaculales bacterium]HQL29161.1 DUF2961 domain-containing protein [Thermoanaerobaculales bacterium]HQN95083.1 DUF2961 domain-containing protein [Thermoanaerobaculales bacterium]HQP43241.1 DUF2961 domain-containing protein [Thermoanaerobaculales bacterium]